MNKNVDSKIVKWLFICKNFEWIQNRKRFTFETRCQGCEFQLVNCLIFRFSDGFGVDLTCFLVIFVFFDVFEALRITRSAIDGLNSIVLENDAAVASVRNKIIIFMAFEMFKFKVLVFINVVGYLMLIYRSLISGASKLYLSFTHIVG